MLGQLLRVVGVSPARQDQAAVLEQQVKIADQPPDPPLGGFGGGLAWPIEFERQ